MESLLAGYWWMKGVINILSLKSDYKLKATAIILNSCEKLVTETAGHMIVIYKLIKLLDTNSSKL